MLSTLSPTAYQKPSHHVTLKKKTKKDLGGYIEKFENILSLYKSNNISLILDFEGSIDNTRTFYI